MPPNYSPVVWLAVKISASGTSVQWPIATTILVLEDLFFATENVTRHMASFPTACGTSTSSTSASKTSNRNKLKCPQCPYPARDHWNRHRRSLTHTDERPFDCALCPYTGRYSWTLKVHHQRHHPGRNFSLPPKVYGKNSCAKNAPANNDHAESDATAAPAHNTAKVNNKSCAPGGCTFCSYMSRLGKYLTKHMATKCSRCLKSTSQTQPRVPSSTSPQVLPNTSHVTSESRATQAPGTLNFASMLCRY